MKPVKLPPRKSGDEIACKWECRLKPGAERRDAGSIAEASRRIRERTRTSGASHPGTSGDVQDGWSSARVREFWTFLPEDARAVLRFLATRASDTPKEDVLAHLGIPIEELSYRLGHMYLAMHECEAPPATPPVRLLTSPWRYAMDTAFAKAVREGAL
jgi:hypothetical protein